MTGSAQCLKVVVFVGTALSLRDDVVTPRRVGLISDHGQDTVAHALLAQAVVTPEDSLSRFLPHATVTTLAPSAARTVSKRAGFRALVISAVARSVVDELAATDMLARARSRFRHLPFPQQQRYTPCQPPPVPTADLTGVTGLWLNP